MVEFYWTNKVNGVDEINNEPEEESATEEDYQNALFDRYGVEHIE